MSINSHLSTCVGTQLPKYLEMAQGHISLSAVLKTDSQVISGHIDKSCKARDPKLEKYLDTVRRLEASFEGFSIKNIPRGENEHADMLAKSAAQGLPLPSEVFLRQLEHLRLNSSKEQYL
jgi:ribonuclease HI